MKKLLLVGTMAAALLAASTVLAKDEVTLVGSGKCAKCALGVADKCQNALVVKQDGKEVTYLLTANDVSKAFHSEICETEKQIKVTGTVKESDGKKEITPTKIELVKS